MVLFYVSLSLSLLLRSCRSPFSCRRRFAAVTSRRGFNTHGKVRNIVLAAPDIDIDLFQMQVRSIPEDQRNFFVLTSSDDRALATSRLIARRSRAGQVPPEILAKLGINVIDLSQVKDTSSLAHTKFVDSPEVVQLLGNRVLAGDSFAEPSSGVEALLVGAGGAVSTLD